MYTVCAASRDASMRQGAQTARSALPSRANCSLPMRLSTVRPSSSRSATGEVAKRNSPGTLSFTRSPGTARTCTTQAPGGVVNAPPADSTTMASVASAATPRAAPPTSSASHPSTRGWLMSRLTYRAA